MYANFCCNISHAKFTFHGGAARIWVISLTIGGYLVKITQHSKRVQAEIAQLVEHATENRSVASPILALGTKEDIRKRMSFFVPTSFY